MNEPITIIENCEPISEWVFLEYRNASEYVNGKIIFANTDDERLAAFGKVNACHFDEIVEPEKTIILDPSAKKQLRTADFKHFRYFVIGGICGDYPPKMRTKSLVSSRLPAAQLRNLGSKQLSTDSAVLMMKLISLGARINEIEIIDSVTIEHGCGESTILPFGYLILEGKVMITPGLIELIEKRRKDEKAVF